MSNAPNQQPPQAYPMFYFQIKRMRPHQGFRQHLTPGPVWNPPKARGSNELVPANTNNYWYGYDGHAVGHLSTIPGPLTQYKQYSLYYENNTFWVVEGDAINQQIGDGRGNPPLYPDTHVVNAPANSDDSDSSSDSDEDDSTPTPHSWSCLAFDYYSQGPYARWGGQRPRLFAQDTPEPWHGRILPYHYINAQQPRPQGLGRGLIGELPILIALLAFSVPEPNVHHALLESMREQYFPSGAPHNFGAGLTDKRGMVVSVYRNSRDLAPRTSNSAPPSLHPRSSPTTLQRFEYGVGPNGKFYP